MNICPLKKIRIIWISDCTEELLTSKEVGHGFGEIDPLNWPWEFYVLPAYTDAYETWINRTNMWGTWCPQESNPVTTDINKGLGCRIGVSLSSDDLKHISDVFSQFTVTMSHHESLFDCLFHFTVPDASWLSIYSTNVSYPFIVSKLYKTKLN